MSAPILRPYQNTIVKKTRSEMRNHRSVIVQSPTGSGKTVLTAYMIRTALERGLSSWFIIHRHELAEQTSKALWKSEVPHGRIQGGKPHTGDMVQVATIQTLVNRVENMVRPNLIIVDEAHHAAANSYRRVIEACPNSWIIGLTATPERTDGAGLNDLFSSIVHGPEVGWLIEQGFLSPYRIIAPPNIVDLTGVHTRGGDWVRGELEAVVDQGSIVGDAVKHYRKYVHPNTCLVYCVSRAHARHVTAIYQAAGIRAAYVAGDTPAGERDAAIEGFRRGNPAVIVSVDLFGEGLDVPGLTAVQLLRPTQSLSLHLQQIGRALRTEEGKSHAIILDHVGNSFRHGLPDDVREWTLEGRKKKKKGEESGPALLHCEECFSVFPAIKGACPLCGWKPKTRVASLPDEVDGELQEIDPEEHRRMRKREEAQAQSFEDLVALAMDRGYKPGWAAHRYAARTKQSPKPLKKRENEIRRELRG